MHIVAGILLTIANLLYFPGLVIDSTCPRVDGSHESWVTHYGVPSVSLPWPGERLDVPALGLLSLVMGIASWSRTTFPPAEVSLEREAAVPVSSQSAPPSARVLNVAPVLGELGRAIVVKEDDAFLGDMVVHYLGDWSRVHFFTGWRR